MKNQSMYNVFERLWYHIVSKFATKESVANKANQTIIRDWTVNTITMISFTLEDGYGIGLDGAFGTFSVPEGYTWAQFCDSEYNPEGYYSIDGDYVACEDSYVVWDSTESKCPTGTDVIVDGRTYSVSA